MTKPKLTRLLTTFFLAFVLGNCSLPSPKSDDSKEGGGEIGESTSFRSVSLAVPVPTEGEIAEDLDSSSEGQVGPTKRQLATSRQKAKGLQTPAKSQTRRMPSPGQVKNSKGTMNYKVLSGDTLMKISYKAFADPLRWREILEDNKDKIKSPSLLPRGIVVLLRTPEFAVILKNGVPYLIRRKDTLSKIAGKVYGKPSEWRKIWKNNPQLISDPNKIYAGFTLYYKEQISR